MTPTDGRPGGWPSPAPTWLVRWGLRGWLAIGVFVLVAALLAVSATLSGVVIPLVVALLLGALLVPIVDFLQRYRIPRALGAVVVLLGLAGVLLWALWLTITGIAEQGGQIAGALGSAVSSIEEWVNSLGVEDGDADALRAGIQDALQNAVGGLAGFASNALGNAFSSASAFVLGVVVGAFFFYYVLLDWHSIIRWMGRFVPSGDVPGSKIIAEAVGAVRAYFGALTLSALVTVVIIGGTALLLGIDLWLTIAVVTFVTSYIPYLGAVVSGVFATTIALGTEGIAAAVIMLAVVLLMQNVIQTVVLTKITSDALHIHPIVNLAATLVGSSLGGILGATLGAPAVATAVRIRDLLDEATTTDRAVPDDGVDPVGAHAHGTDADGAGSAG